MISTVDGRSEKMSWQMYPIVVYREHVSSTFFSHLQKGLDMKRRFAWAAALLVGLTVSMASSWAADYPSRSIKWVVPYPPAGTTDVLARIVAQALSERLGQQVIVENKAGGGNNIGTEFVVNAPADGYTMLLVNPANGINATLYKKLNFNFIRDITPVAGLVRTPNVMVITNSLPVKSVAEFITYCKANPTKVNMASSGSGTSVHLSGELFKYMTGCTMAHIPYKGAGPALTDLIAGQVHVLFDNLPSSVPHIKSGRIRALAVTSKNREPSMPETPTVGDTVPGYEATAWFGVGMPKGVPREAVERINQEINRILVDPKMRERLAELGGLPIPGTPDDFAKTIALETDRWGRAVIASGATAE
jgi:tripartite-type tricarboxylate transporter receptor subunit TctC